jgi:hypothetical protein
MTVCVVVVLRRRPDTFLAFELAFLLPASRLPSPSIENLHHLTPTMASSFSSSSAYLRPPSVPVAGPSASTTPSEHSDSAAPSQDEDAPADDSTPDAPKKKRKKKKRAKKLPKLSEEEKEEQMVKAAEALALEEKKASKRKDKPRTQSVLCISRNKHWRHISAYHVRTQASPLSS